MASSSLADSLLSDEQRSIIESAIQHAELRTSGEIRVHLDDFCDEQVLDRAAYVFAQLEMHRTEQRNGVLIYVALQDRKLAIIGDQGIHAKVGAGFWNSTFDLIVSHMKKDEWVEGLCAGVMKAGEELKKHFPRASDDVNELSNTITTGKIKS
jgi:uncharacterized membrane protein